MNFIEVLGIIGASIVTYSNLPQVVLFFKQGHAQGISLSSTWLGLIGVGLRTLYLIKVTAFNLTVLIPYFVALSCLIITIFYCYFPRKGKNGV